MGRLAFRLYISIMLSIAIFNLLYIFSEGILSKNLQNIVLYSVIISIFLAIFFTWTIDMIIHQDIKIYELELEIEDLKRKINLLDNEE